MKKLLTLILIGLLANWLIGSIVSPPPAYALGWRDSSFGAEFDAADLNGEVNAGAYVDRANKGNLVSIMCQIIPVMGLCTEDESRIQGMIQNSAVGKITNYVVAMYSTPPASTYAFIMDTGQSLGFFPKQVYAQGIPQGIGFAGLSALLPLWKTFRNIAYFLLAIVMIVIGFMVMFRKKIDPKTVITVQNALPRIVVTLLLITFSYAIVGILIDLMYLVILLCYSIFQASNILPNLDPSKYANGSLLSIFDIKESTIPWRVLFGLNWSPAILTALSAASITVGAVVAILASSIPVVAVPVFLAGLALPLLGFIVSIAMLFLVIRLFIFFLGAYIKIILSLIFGPFQILTEAIPGSNGFVSWFKHLLSNILVFPVGAVMFMLSAAIMNFSDTSQSLWSPPYAALLVNNTVSVGTLLAIGILFAIPSIANQVQDIFKAKPFVQAGPEGVIGTLSQPVAFGWTIAQFLLQREQFRKLGEAISKEKK